MAFLSGERGSVPATGGSGLQAKVQASDGWPVSNAVVTVTDVGGAQIDRAPVDEDGLARTSVLRPDTYTVIITAPGFTPLARLAVVSSSGTADLGTITLARLSDTALPDPGRWTVDPIHSTITVTARHLGLASIRGRFNEFSAEIDIARPVETSKVRAVIQAASIDTGNKMRDDHLRSADFLDVDTFPTVEFLASGMTPSESDRWTLPGTLTINGQTKQVPLELSYHGVGDDQWGGTRAAFHAETELHRDDFAINYSEVVRAGIAAVGTKLKVEIDIEAVQGDLPVM